MSDQFHILTYVCSWCDATLCVWNPLDAESPSVLLCRDCGESHVMSRVDKLARYAPGFVCSPGHAFFAEGTPEDAISKLERRKVSALYFADNKSARAEEDIHRYYDEQIEMVKNGTHPSFPPGYILIVY